MLVEAKKLASSHLLRSVLYVKSFAVYALKHEALRYSRKLPRYSVYKTKWAKNY
jgi:hypothetical protein